MTGDPHQQARHRIPDSELDEAPVHRKAANAMPFAQRLSCTIAEACAATGLGRTKLYELIGAGSVDTTLIGRRRLVSVKSLLHLIGPTQGR